MNLKTIQTRLLALFFPIISFLLPAIASAHEVYVLNSSEVSHDVSLPPLNLFSIAVENGQQFLLIAFLAILGVVCILGISVSRKLENLLDPILLKIKPYAPYISQVTIGLAVLASAYYGALFGTELPFTHLFGSYAHLVAILLYISAFSFLFGVYARIGGFITMIIYIAAIFSGPGIYMISYMTYLGTSIFMIILGGGYNLFDFGESFGFHQHKIISYLRERKYFIIRIFFSTSLIYSALYAKLIHGQLALDTVNKYHLTDYFHFSPAFVVLGAFIVEIVVGLFYLLGFEVRFASLLFLTFLTMSLLFFGESVWPHLILIGTALSMLVHGYDEYSIERRWYLKGIKEPVF